MYVTAREEPAHVLSRLGGASFYTLPCGRSRLMYATAWEGPAYVRYRSGGAGSCTLPCGRAAIVIVIVIAIVKNTI